jgi:hypothetical protein
VITLSIPRGTASIPGTASIRRGTGSIPRGTAWRPRGTGSIPRGTAWRPRGRAERDAVVRCVICGERARALFFRIKTKNLCPERPCGGKRCGTCERAGSTSRYRPRGHRIHSDAARSAAREPRSWQPKSIQRPPRCSDCDRASSSPCLRAEWVGLRRSRQNDGSNNGYGEIRGHTSSSRNRVAVSPNPGCRTDLRRRVARVWLAAALPGFQHRLRRCRARGVAHAGALRAECFLLGWEEECSRALSADRAARRRIAFIALAPTWAPCSPTWDRSNPAWARTTPSGLRGWGIWAVFSGRPAS